MSENLVIPPVPEERQQKYLWIDKMVELGWSVVRACEMAEVPKISYYKLYKNKGPSTDTAEANDQPCDETTNQDDRTGSDSTSVAMTTSGDKAS